MVTPLKECSCHAGSVVRPHVDDNIADAPEVTPATRRVYSGKGISTELVCHVTGYPEPMVSWYFLTRGQQTEVRPDPGHVYSREEDSHRLSIRSLSYTELTNFTCRAENEEGVSTGSIEVTGVPRPPGVLSPRQGEQISSYSLVFSVQSYQPLLQVKIQLWPQVSLELLISK